MAVTALEIETRSLVLDGRPFGAGGEAVVEHAGQLWDFLHEETTR
jgi:hypothetical protein